MSERVPRRQFRPPRTILDHRRPGRHGGVLLHGELRLQLSIRPARGARHPQYPVALLHRSHSMRARPFPVQRRAPSCGDRAGFVVGDDLPRRGRPRRARRSRHHGRGEVGHADGDASGHDHGDDETPSKPSARDRDTPIVVSPANRRQRRSRYGRIACTGTESKERPMRLLRVQRAESVLRADGREIFRRGSAKFFTARERLHGARRGIDDATRADPVDGSDLWARPHLRSSLNQSMALVGGMAAVASPPGGPLSSLRRSSPKTWTLSLLRRPSTIARFSGPKKPPSTSSCERFT